MPLDRWTSRREKRLQREQERKEALRLARRQHELTMARRRGELGTVVEVDPPIHAGWERYFVVRHDFRRSDEAPYLDRVLTLCQRVESCSRRGVVKQRDYKRGGKLYEVPHKLKRISAEKYWLLTPKLQTYFVLAVEREDGVIDTRNPEFEVAHPWKFSSRVRESFITHRLIPDSDAASEVAEIDELLGWGQRMYRLWIKWMGGRGKSTWLSEGDAVQKLQEARANADQGVAE